MTDRALNNAKTVSEWYKSYSENYRIDSSILSTVRNYTDDIDYVINQMVGWTDPYSGYKFKSYLEELDEIISEATLNAKRAQDAADKRKNASVSILAAVNPNALLRASSEEPEDEHNTEESLLSSSVPNETLDSTVVLNATEDVPAPTEPASVSTDTVSSKENESTDVPTADEVIDKINEAERQEAGAGAAAVFFDKDTRKEIILDEGTAVYRDEQAKTALKEAEELRKAAEDAGLIEKVEQEVEDAGKAVDDLRDKTSEEVIAKSDKDVDDAEAAYNERINAETYEAYKAAADKAKAAYEDALALYNAASDAYTEADAKYQEALAAYVEASEQYEALLTTANEGLADLQSAQAKAKAARDAAKEYLDKVSKDNEDAKEAAEKATKQLSEDWESLKKAVDKLTSAITSTASAFAKDLGKTTLTGIGYSVADLIADYYDVNVDHDEEPIVKLQDDIATEEKHLALELLSRLNEENSNTLSDKDREEIKIN